jgi:hypothetical protein
VRGAIDAAAIAATSPDDLHDAIARFCVALLKQAELERAAASARKDGECRAEAAEAMAARITALTQSVVTGNLTERLDIGGADEK